MPDRTLNRPERRSAGTALVLTAVAHAGLLVAVLWPASGSGTEQRTASNAPLELVVMAGNDSGRPGPGTSAAARPEKPVQLREEPAGLPALAADAQPPLTTPAASSPSRQQEFVSAAGTGDGTGTSFFQAAATGHKVVYVLDRSMSMGLHDGLRQARAELLASLGRLPATARFQIIAYNQVAEPISVHDYGGMLSADAGTVAEVGRLLAALRPTGLTDHVKALCRGIQLEPDTLFLATDADELTAGEVAAVTRFNGGRCSIHVIEFNSHSDSAANLLRQLAEQNRGSYRRVAVNAL